MTAGVLTLGTFDLFHRGHVRLLARAADLGPVTVALNTDRFVTQYKGRPPILTYQERYEVVAACRHVTHVVANSENGNSRGVITACKPRYVVIGDDWLDQHYLAQLQIDNEFLEKQDVSIVFVPYTRGVSTTDILRRCDLARERVGAKSDAGKPPLPDLPPIRDADVRERYERRWNTETSGAVPRRDLHTVREPGGLGAPETQPGLAGSHR